jgi:hypothetical protein
MSSKILIFNGLRGLRRTYHTILKLADNALFKIVRYVHLVTSEAGARRPRSISNLWCLAELFGRPSTSPRTSLKSADSDFENTSDSDSACLFVYAFIL